MHLTRRIAVAATIIIWNVGCAGGDERDGDAHGWTARVDTLGDSITVRTVAGSVWGDTAWLEAEVRIGVLEGSDEYMLGNVRSLAVNDTGEIYVMDSYVPALRKYSPDGEHLGDLGREGGGPGEYKSPDGGLGVLPDGRVLLRDPGNARFNVYAPDGSHLTSWRLPSGGGFNTSSQLRIDAEGNSYTLVLLEMDKVPWEWEYGMARYTAEGELTDTVLAPTWDYERPSITGQRENSSSSTGVPFSATTQWAISPLGYMVGGVSTGYRVDLYRIGEPVLRMEKEWTPVPVGPEEAEEQERRITESFSRRFPGWRWNGPPIPDVKPAFTDLFVGDDGMIWVQVSRPGRPVISVEEAREEEQRTGRPQTRYRAPVAFDVFDPDGRFLGHVRTPDEFRTSPTPVFRGDYVWAVVRDELDVMYVVRYRVVHRPAT